MSLADKHHITSPPFFYPIAPINHNKQSTKQFSYFQTSTGI